MKKLSLLIALCMLISIGGVYAIWTYGGAAPEANHKHMSINLQTVTNSAAEGVIRLIKNSMDVEICDDNADYDAELKFSGFMAFYFEPHQGASLDVQNNGIPLQWVVEQTESALEFGGEKVFNIKMAAPEQLTAREVTEGEVSNLNAEYPGVAWDQYIGKKVFIVSAEMVNDQVDTSLCLATYTDYTLFSKLLGESAAKIGITVSKYTAPATP